MAGSIEQAVDGADAFVFLTGHNEFKQIPLVRLAELAADTPFGQKGMLVLVLLCRWAAFDDQNNVAMNVDLTQNTTTASVFRLRGNPFNRAI